MDEPSLTSTRTLRRLGLRRILDPLFRAATVAVIADPPGAAGRAVLGQAAAGPLAGAVHAVGFAEVPAGARGWAAVVDLPPVDVAVLDLPASRAAAVLDRLAGGRASTAIVLGAADAPLVPRPGWPRVLGPDAAGIMVPASGLVLSPVAPPPEPGRIAFACQSTALGAAVLDWARDEGIGFSAWVAGGALHDLGWGDLIGRFAEDPRSDAILLHLESVGDARAFLAAAREVAPRKPVVVMKAGRTAAGARAAASHTGALAQADAVLDAALVRAGVLRVDTIEDLFQAAEVLARQGAPRGRRVAIITNGGGPGVIATDALAAAGGEPAAGSPRDLGPDADGAAFAAAVRAAMADPGADAALAICAPQPGCDPTAIAAALARIPAAAGRPLLAAWMGGGRMNAGRGLLARAGIPVFPFPDAAVRMAALLWRHGEDLRLLHETPHAPDDGGDGGPDRTVIDSIERTALLAGRTLLAEPEATRLLAAWGLPVLAIRTAADADGAVAAAEALGWPVAVKLWSEGVAHTSAGGGVHLDLRDARAVRAACAAIAAGAGPGMRGFSVQPFVAPADGHEILLGSACDPHLGPVVLVGAGGRHAERLADTALGLPPLTPLLARRMLAAIRIGRALPAAAVAPLADLMVRFSHLVAERPWIREIDINPLFVAADRLVALDAGVVLHPADARPDTLPRPAIRPYPAEYAGGLTLGDGSPAAVRPIRPADEPAMVRFHQGLSERTVDHRWLRPLPLASRIDHHRLAGVCHNDYDREIALVIDRRTGAGDAHEILAIGRLTRLREDPGCAELGMVVGDPWQGRGLGRELTRRLVAIAASEGIRRIVCHIRDGNAAGASLLTAAGFTLQPPEDGLVTAVREA
jgi:acetyltransferase